MTKGSDLLVAALESEGVGVAPVLSFNRTVRRIPKGSNICGERARRNPRTPRQENLSLH